MHDWKELVRNRLSPLPLEPSRREEIIEELAQQLEDAYDEQLAGGASDSAALQRSLAQFQDWEGLRKNVFHAVKAAELPVWQQSGILSPRRRGLDRAGSFFSPRRAFWFPQSCYAFDSSRKFVE